MSLRYKSIPVPSASSLTKSTTYNLHPFGTRIAEEIFSARDWDDCELDDEEISYHHDERIHDFPEQLELNLMNVREMEQHHTQEISKFQRAYKKMCHHALKWAYLMEDVESNPQIKKMFQDLQLMRKLSGTDHI